MTNPEPDPWTAPPQQPSQMPYQQMPYQPAPPPYVPVVVKSGDNGFAVTAMVVGIVGLVLCWIPGLNLVLGIIATTFGGIGVYKANRNPAANKGMAIAGLVLGILTVVAAISLWIALAAAFSSG